MHDHYEVSQDTIDHLGVFSGRMEIASAPGEGKRVTVTDLSMTDLSMTDLSIRFMVDGSLGDLV